MHLNIGKTYKELGYLGSFLKLALEYCGYCARVVNL
uniref:Uncharacterized protein n=1 Tax=Anguilla anguilla TaxID=7936 RepID=A0A0E9RKB0_ANGAN